MNTVRRAVLGLLILLAISSGVAKLMLMPQEVAFFSQYGFSQLMIVGFGVAQLLGGVAMIFNRFRTPGAVIVLVTFAMSAVMLFMDSQIGIGVITLVAIGLIGWLMRQNPGLSKGVRSD